MKTVSTGHTTLPTAAPTQKVADTPIKVNTVRYLTPRCQSQLVNLIGERCKVNCFFDEHPVKVLWDSGAQTCIINDQWRQRHLPHTVIRPISDILGEEKLELLAANDTPIPYMGWIEVSFRLEDDPFNTSRLRVPILVSSDSAVATDPIIGYNVIGAIVNRNEVKTKRGKRQLAHQVGRAFEVTVKTAQRVVKLLQDSAEDPETGVARTGGTRVPLPANQVTTVYVRAHVGTQCQGEDMLFSPDLLHLVPEGVVCTEVLVRIPEKNRPYVPIPLTNTTNHTIYLERHKVVGLLESVKTVYAATRHNDGANIMGVQVNETASVPTEHRSRQEERALSWDPPVDLKHLTNVQQEAAKRMLRDECQAFAFDGDDVGCIPSLQMHITLNDNSPVQKTYTSVPKPLHNEVKEYLQDLLNRGWIVPSRSPYSSPVVCV